DGGFALPEAKSGTAWVDADTLFVTTDFGEGSLPDSGYPRQVKLWKRGTPLDDATLIFEGETADVAVGAYVDHTPGFEREIVYRAVTFYTQEYHLRTDEALVRLDIPNDANAWPHREWLLVELRSDWV